MDIMVWSQSNERYRDCCVMECDQFGGGSVLVWGGISYDGRTDLHIIMVRLTVNEILMPHVIPYPGTIQWWGIYFNAR